MTSFATGGLIAWPSGVCCDAEGAGMTVGETSQRIDKWLWHARMARTRTLAAKLVISGKVRLNTQRITRASQTVRCGDVLTLPQGERIRVIKITDIAQTLYDDLTPPPVERAPAAAQRAAGSGRPTKRERRALDRLKQGHDA